MEDRKSIFFSAAAALTLASAVAFTPTQSRADADPFLGDIQMGGYNFCPRGWASAEGQILPISQNSALFSLLGTTYGGDGRTTFALPDLRSRAGMGFGNGPGLSNVREGQKRGVEAVVLGEVNLPPHIHTVNANNLDGDKPGPGGKLLAAAPPSGAGSETIYSDQPATVTMNSAMIGRVGGNQQLSVLDPYIGIRFCIALQGVFPSRS